MAADSVATVFEDAVSAVAVSGAMAWAAAWLPITWPVFVIPISEADRAISKSIR